MGTLFVDKLDPQSGTSLELGSSGDTVSVNTGATTSLLGNVTLGASGKTITVPSGCTITNNGTQTGFGGVNAPYFFASVTTNQTINHDTTTKCSFDRADVDSASGYDTTNKRYTIPSGKGGYWHIGYTVTMDASGEYVKSCYVYPKKNGSDWPSFNSRHQGVSYFRMDGNPMRHCAIEKSFIANISAGEYIEIFVNMGHTNGTGNTGGAHDYYSIFWGYKLAGG